MIFKTRINLFVEYNDFEFFESCSLTKPRFMHFLHTHEKNTYLVNSALTSMFSYTGFVVIDI